MYYLEFQSSSTVQCFYPLHPLMCPVSNAPSLRLCRLLDFPALASSSQPVLNHHHSLSSVDVHEPRTTTLGFPICVQSTPWAEVIGGFFITEGVNDKRLLVTARHVVFTPDKSKNEHFEHKNNIQRCYYVMPFGDVWAMLRSKSTSSLSKPRLEANLILLSISSNVLGQLRGWMNWQRTRSARGPRSS